MAILSVVVAAALAVGGWIVNGILARRSARRDLRVSYLLSAYRSLDGASNRRAMTATHEHDLESAVADVMLLGSERQVSLAVEFAREFSTKGHADTSGLLESLRADLRRELALGRVDDRRVWLRIESGSQWAEQFARVRASLAQPALVAPPANEALVHIEPSSASAETQVGLIAAAYSEVEGALLARYPEELRDVSGSVSAGALRRVLVSPPSAQALEGLSIMRDLAVSRPDRIGPKEAEEFVTLAKALSYAIRTERTNP